MSESLKTMLHERATSVAFKPPDLATITRAGGRRVRRRRMVATLTAVAAVALAGSGVALSVGGQPDGGAPSVPLSPWTRGAVSWAFGSTIYVATDAGTEEIEVGHEVRAYVRTSTGFVVVDETDAVYAVSELGVTVLGQVHDKLADDTDQQRLAVNARGTLVGWVDESATPGDRTFRTYDARSGTTRDYPGGATSTEDAIFFAIDDRTAYWRTRDVVHEVDLDTGEDRPIVLRFDLSPGEISAFELYSAENGVLAFSQSNDKTVDVGESVDDAITVWDNRRPENQIPDGVQVAGAELINGHTDPVRLSPTGAWVSFGIYEALSTLVGEPGPDQEYETSDAQISPVVFDTDTGEQVSLDLAAGPFAYPLVWLDDTSLQVVVFTIDPQQPEVPTAVSFYRCTLPDGACEVAAEVAPPYTESGAFPDGRYYQAP
jgi:hypothetical protein